MGYLPLANIPYLLLIRGSHEPEDALTLGKPTAESNAESNTNTQNKQTTTEFSTRGWRAHARALFAIAMTTGI